MIELSLIRDLVAIFGVIAGFSYYVLTVRVNQKNQEIMIKNQEQTLKTRSATFFQQTVGQLTQNPENIMKLVILQNSQFSSLEEEYELRNNNPEYMKARLWFENVAEQCGYFIKQGVLDVEALATYSPWWWSWYWEKYKDLIYDLRTKTNRPSYLKNCEYVFTKIQEYQEEHPEILSPYNNQNSLSTIIFVILREIQYTSYMRLRFGYGLPEV